MAQRDQRLDSGKRARPSASSRASAPHERSAPRRALRRLRGSQRYLPLLIAVALVSTFGLAAITYVAARVNATAQAQANALHDAAIARQLIADQGPGLTVSGGNLVVGADNSIYTLNGETTLVDRTHSLTGDYASIYQLEGSQLVAVASDVPVGGSAHAVGATLTGSAFTTLLGNCGAFDSQTCHQSYSGLLTIHGTQYVVGLQPLFDATGAFVGALGAAQPLSAVLAPVNQFAVVLLLVGLLLSFVCIVAGVWLLGTRSEKMLATIDARLDGVAEAATDLERLAHSQIIRANARSRTAHELNEHTHALDALSAAMEHGQVALRESAGGIWNEMSQPGAAPDPQSTMRWAREAAVVSSRIGTAAEQARDVCRQLLTLVNHIVAENGVATDAGREMQYHARELRRSIDGVESALGERLITRPHGIAASPLVRRMRRWLPAHELDRTSNSAPISYATNKVPSVHPRTSQTGQHTAAHRAQTPAEPLVSESLWINNGTRTPTGQQRTPRPDDFFAQQPPMRSPSTPPQRPSGTGEYPRTQTGQSGLWSGQRPSNPAPRPSQPPRIPSNPSAWTGEYPAAPRMRPPSGSTTGREDGPHGPPISFGTSGQQGSLQWRPLSGPRDPDPFQHTSPMPASGQPNDAQSWSSFDTESLPAFDSNEHPRYNGSNPDPRWPDEQP